VAPQAAKSETDDGAGEVVRLRLRLRLRGGFVEISWAVMKLVHLIGNNQAEAKDEVERLLRRNIMVCEEVSTPNRKQSG
jgi:hypothetical protein